ncbi:MAG: GNAT family N-acetyltransferase [Lachnospiraceae bacterium]|nr:GNAT family N-acetyltransferase [Lachnospiraceae bacterium]
MRIRPYIESKDYEYVEKWIDDEKIHALWCANLIPYPVTRENLHVFLERNAIEWTDSAYVATETDGSPVGFFCYSINVDDDTGFLKFIIVDPKKRGTGYGKEMLKLAIQYAFEITDVKSVHLNVFRENRIAKHCYEKIGFVEESMTENVFSYKNELWSRCHMVIPKR